MLQDTALHDLLDPREFSMAALLALAVAGLQPFS